MFSKKIFFLCCRLSLNLYKFHPRGVENFIHFLSKFMTLGQMCMKRKKMNAFEARTFSWVIWAFRPNSHMNCNQMHIFHMVDERVFFEDARKFSTLINCLNMSRGMMCCAVHASNGRERKNLLLWIIACVHLMNAVEAKKLNVGNFWWKMINRYYWAWVSMLFCG